MSNFINSYVPLIKKPVVIPDPNVPYDINFRYPARELESDRLKLVPFVPWIFGQRFFEELQAHPELVTYLPWHPFDSAQAFYEHYEEKIRNDPSWCVFAILDKSKPGPEQGTTPPMLDLTRSDSQRSADLSGAPIAVRDQHAALAGTIGYLNALPEQASVEIGYVIVLPAYQRTFVSTHAIGTLLRYALERPRDGGLGLRRVQWQAHASNGPSIRAAQRMGLKMEGIVRWERTLPVDKECGLVTREGDVLQRRGRHSAMLAMCWDDWESEGREHVRKMMARRS